MHLSRINAILSPVIFMIGKIKEIWKNSLIFSLIESLVNRHFRKRLKNEDFTILCPNCIGGVIYHRLGQRFDSPTVDLAINTHQFCIFFSHLDYYLSKDMKELPPDAHGIPCGSIEGNHADLPDILIRFVHYHNYQEAKEAWQRRKQRIHKDNLYLILYDINDMDSDDPNTAGYIQPEDLEMFNNFPCNNKVLLTRNPHQTSTYAQYIKPNWTDNYPLVYMTRDLFGLNGFEKKFDYVSFLNKNSKF